MSFWRGRRVLVTGGAGFIGSHVVERLLDLGARVTAADKDAGRTSLWLQPSVDGVSVMIGDLTESNFVDQATRGQDAVFHLAARMAGLKYNAAHPAEMLVENTLLGMQVLKWCARNHVPQVLFCSGALVYDVDRPAAPTPEDASTSGRANPDCEGSVWASRIVERAARYFMQESDLKVVIARLANVYGPRDDFSPETAHLIGNVIRTVAEGKIPELHGDGAQSRGYLYVTDAVEALLLLGEVGAHGETVNICSRTEVTVREVIETILDVMGKHVSPIPRSGPTGVARRLLETSKLVALTGFEERISFRDGVSRTVEWFLNHHTALGL